jgi:formylglycine-generating enzyme required for sulfatase activity
MIALIAVTALSAPIAAEEDDPCKSFIEELVAVEPGKGKFPRSVKIGERTLAPGAFRIAKYETPQNLYEAIGGVNPSRWKGKRNSVEMVSFAEAEDFCKRLEAKLKERKLLGADQTVRLPTEAEWEYACRAGTTTKYSFGEGEADLGDFGWFDGNARGNDPPVGAKKPNPWGLYDMHGYVWEWCSRGEPIKAGKAPARGGAWTSGAGECASGSRVEIAGEDRRPDVGFRCVVAAIRTK